MNGIVFLFNFKPFQLWKTLSFGECCSHHLYKLEVTEFQPKFVVSFQEHWGWNSNTFLTISSELGGIDHWPQIIYLFIHFCHKTNHSAHHSFDWQFPWGFCPLGRWLCFLGVGQCCWDHKGAQAMFLSWWQASPGLFLGWVAGIWERTDRHWTLWGQTPSPDGRYFRTICKGTWI